MEDVRETIEAVARGSYVRLVAYLAARTRDVAGAEDALGEALLAALETWPQDGVPRKPEAWLLATARRRLIDRSRHERVRAASRLTLELIAEETDKAELTDEFPDERLKLLFVCAHPAIDPGVRTPLMLQCVLGLDAARIAQAFLVSPAAMGQRLTRAKAKIRNAGIAFEVPEERELPQRLDAVLDAIYAAYSSGWEDAAGTDPRRCGLTDEAIRIARLLVQQMPSEPEARGLLALLLYCESRRGAPRTGWPVRSFIRARRAPVVSVDHRRGGTRAGRRRATETARPVSARNKARPFTVQQKQPCTTLRRHCDTSLKTLRLKFLKLFLR